MLIELRVLSNLNRRVPNHHGGELGEHKGINLTRRKLRIPA